MIFFLNTSVFFLIVMVAFVPLKHPPNAISLRVFVQAFETASVHPGSFCHQTLLVFVLLIVYPGPLLMRETVNRRLKITI